jgi:hypothetical protein
VRAENSVAGRKVNPAVPQPARTWNFWPGGKDYYPADEQAGDECFPWFPGIFDLARSCRDFYARMTRHLAAAGIRQFRDIGAGLPAPDGDNTHQAAQRAAPGCSVVYADNDPLAVAFGQALLTSRPPGSSDCISAAEGLAEAEPFTCRQARGPRHAHPRAGHTAHPTGGHPAAIPITPAHCNETRPAAPSMPPPNPTWSCSEIRASRRLSAPGEMRA